jgi:hypothetical protein
VALRKFLSAVSYFSMTGTTPTSQFEYGTGAACTSPVVLPGAFQADIAAAIGQYMYGDGEMTIFSGRVSNGICAVTTGTPTSKAW